MNFNFCVSKIENNSPTTCWMEFKLYNNSSKILQAIAAEVDFYLKDNELLDSSAVVMGVVRKKKSETAYIEAPASCSELEKVHIRDFSVCKWGGKNYRNCHVITGAQYDSLVRVTVEK